MNINIDQHFRDNEEMDARYAQFGREVAATKETFIELAERASKEAEAKAVAMAVEAADISECDHVGEYLYALPKSPYQVFRCRLCKHTWTVDSRDEQ